MGLLAAGLTACVSLQRPQGLDEADAPDGRADLPAEAPDGPARPDVPDPRDAADMDARDAADAADAPDLRDGPDAPDLRDVTDADVRDADVVDVVDVVDVADVADARDAADVVDAPDARDAADADAPDVRDAADADVPDARDAADADAPGADVDVPDAPACGTGLTRCGAACVDLNSDESHCGVCGRSCAAPNVNPRCLVGACRITCLAGFSNCDGDAANGCEARIEFDAANCGACGRACATGRVCAGGACVTQRSCPSAGTPGCGLVSIGEATLTIGTATSCGTMPDSACGVDAAPPVPGVQVSAFQMDAYEVTVARFRLFWADRSRDGGASIRAAPVAYPAATLSWGAAGREPATSASFNWSATPGAREAHPLNGVDFWTAMEFCVWDGGRLPTEAEWELAARGRGAVGRIYPWGDTPPPAMACSERAHWLFCAGEDGALTRRVGQFPSTGGGLFDLAGNLAEWTADVRNADRATCWRSFANPLCLDGASSERYLRGGSYFTISDPAMRAASRAVQSATSQSSSVGFRCVRGG